MWHLVFGLTGFAILLSGCQLIEPEQQAMGRTLPAAQDYPLIKLEDVRTPSVAPGNYNMRAFVVGLSKCPGEDGCQYPQQHIDFCHTAYDL